jgi:hypothetical protein
VSDWNAFQGSSIPTENIHFGRGSRLARQELIPSPRYITPVWNSSSLQINQADPASNYIIGLVIESPLRNLSLPYLPYFGLPCSLRPFSSQRLRSSLLRWPPRLLTPTRDTVTFLIREIKLLFEIGTRIPTARPLSSSNELPVLLAVRVSSTFSQPLYSFSSAQKSIFICGLLLKLRYPILPK